MFGWFKRNKWPKIPLEEMRKRARLLVIDDHDFPYEALFKRDGYAVDKWDDVNNLSGLERGDFDVILLDIHGVGQQESAEQGFGVLKHLRKTSPTQIVIAYSSADWSLRYQEFFDLADARLDKHADYVEFKRVVDEQLRLRFSLGFYVDRAMRAIGASSSDPKELREMISKAILTRNLPRLEKQLRGRVESVDIIHIVIGIAQTAIAIAGL